MSFPPLAAPGIGGLNSGLRTVSCRFPEESAPRRFWRCFDRARSWALSKPLKITTVLGVDRCLIERAWQGTVWAAWEL
jgi:hypothetical protein